ncbi:carbohydrate kinase [Pseudooceanicola sp.]|uniref:carbohydrate kinase family protein n=1 Tax=Pseudooceanicola sp. TaxID=1914328 RepID=UPI00351893F5
MSQGRILCCGEALIDMIPGGGGYVPHTGGAVFNTAIALGRLGARAGMLTGLSRDMFGAMLEAELAASRVDTELVIRSDRPTTLAFVQLTEGKARYTFYDENSAGRMISADDLPELPEDVGTLFFGGISLVVEPGAEAYAALLSREAGQRVVMIDPNIRPGFVTDEARYRTRLGAMIGQADLMKVSDEDLDWLVPGAATVAEKLRSLPGPRVSVVTEGAAGATAYLSGGGAVSVAARAVEVADTVGAGDSFNAGFLAALDARGLLTKAGIAGIGPEAVRAALAQANAVAAITVSRDGANPPWAAELASA